MQEHNLIRQREDAFSKTIKSLEIISGYSNVNLVISTTVMKINYLSINDLQRFVKEKFPKAQHLIGPCIPCSQEGFSKSDFNSLFEIIPELFNFAYVGKKENRCQGGVSGACLCSNGNVKICTAAPDIDEFILGNINEKGLKEIWINPNSTIWYYRKEKNCSQNQCKKCEKKCYKKNCRLMAYAYEKDYKKANPFTCFLTQKEGVQNENRSFLFKIFKKNR